MLTSNFEYSEKELQMFEALGWERRLVTALAPSSITRMAVEKAFIFAQQGLAVESLRRVAAALNLCQIYRMTPEWDAMIEL